MRTHRITRAISSGSALLAGVVATLSLGVTPAAAHPEPVVAGADVGDQRLEGHGTSGPGASAQASGADGLFQLNDDFERADGDLGGDWVDCKQSDPDSFEPIGIHDAGTVISDPETRSGTYDTTPPSGHPPTEGRLHPGIGCAWVDTESTTVSVVAEWSGNHGHATGPPVSHVEATPLLYVTTGHPRYGFGAWPSELFGVPVLLSGYIGATPEEFEFVAAALFPGNGEHESGTSREIELRAELPGMVTVWMDGVQAEFGGGIGLDPIAVDPTMIDSTRHGFAIDAHLVDPRSNIPDIKGLEEIEITELIPNSAPVLDPVGNRTVDEGSPLGFTATATDVDVPAQTLTFSLDDGVAGSVPVGASITTGGVFAWTPSEAQGPGVYTFDVVVTDDGIPVLEDRQTIIVTVDEVNAPPVAANDEYTTDASTELSVVAPGVLANDVDADGDPLTSVKATDPASGIVTLAADGEFTYTPDPGFSGSDSFTYVAHDGTVDSAPATVTIIVGAPAIEQVASSEVTTDGTIGTGGLADTFSSDDGYEELVEETSRGRPQNRTSVLDHRWLIEVSGGDAVTVHLEAHHSAADENFTAWYSTDDEIWIEMLTITKTADDDQAQQFPLPFDTSGTVWIRVTDTDQTAGNATIDSIYVDHLAVVTENPIPEVSIAATDPLAAEPADPGSFTITRTGGTTGTLSVTYSVAGTAENGTDYTAVTGVAVIPDGQPAVVVPIDPIDDALAEGSESVVVTLAPGTDYSIGSASTDTVTIVDDDLTSAEDVATTDQTVHGTRSTGDVTSTHLSDDGYEGISEALFAGGKRSRLEHIWTIDVTGGSSVTFFVEAHHPDATEDFVFSYSVDQVEWVEMLTVTKVADDDQFQQFTLPATTSGTVYIQVTDLDRSNNESTLQTILVDWLYVLSSS